jgi:hypothetical protein
MSEGAVFVATNHREGNEILVYKRNNDGLLEGCGSYPTTGKGIGANGLNPDSLGSQNSLILNQDKTLLFVVNTHEDSDNISMFRVNSNPLSLSFLRPIPIPRGKFPVSLTIYGNSLYVLTAGISERRIDSLIVGFHVNVDGKVKEIENSDRRLNFFAKSDNRFSRDINILETPSQIQFSPDGKFLVVTIKGAITRTTPSRILVYPVDFVQGDYIPSITPITKEITRRPFGFTFYDNNKLFVCEITPPSQTDRGVFRLTDNDVKTTVTTYEILSTDSDVILEKRDEKSPSGTVFCWTGGPKPKPGTSRITFTANFGTHNVSSYQIDEHSLITPGDPNQANWFPLEMCLDQDDKFVYITQPGNGIISIWKLEDNQLVRVGEQGGLPVYDANNPMRGGAIAGIAVY